MVLHNLCLIMPTSMYFHSMGGIACVTSSGSENNSPIKREVKLQYSEIIGTFGQSAMKTYTANQLFQQCSISRGLGSLTPPLVDDDPPLVTAKSGLGGRI